MKKSLVFYGVVLIIASAFVWQCIGAWQDSQTTDEAVHLAAGRIYWQTGNFNINPEHPALFKLWAALPLALAPYTTIDTDTEAWEKQNQWTIGASYLYLGRAQYRYGANFLLFVGRWQMILVWLGLVVTLSVLSWRRWGQWASLVVTALVAYDPNLLGHGHLVTNDIATSFAYLGTFLFLHRFIKQPSWRTLMKFSAIFAVAQLTKFSAAILWVLVPFVLLIARWYQLPGVTWRWVGRLMIGCVIVTGLMTWAVYDFRIDRITNDPRIAQLWNERQDVVSRHALDTVPAYTRFFIELANPVSLTGQFLSQFQHAAIPGYWYWRGLFSAASHNVYGHGAYLLGRVSLLGWWYYFPVAMAVKTPILLLCSVLAFIAFWIVHLIREIRQRVPFKHLIPFESWILGFPPVIYLLWSMASHINIGLRHVFPSYIFFPLTAGSLVAIVQRRHPRYVPALASTMAIITILVAILAWPNTIGYYNGLIGGTNQGNRYVLDSNMDWNQDIWRLRTFLHQHQFSNVHVVLFGSIPYDHIFSDLQPVPQNSEIKRGLQPSGIIAISKGQLYNVDGPFAWLRSYSPTWRIGSSINVYDFR